MQATGQAVIESFITYPVPNIPHRTIPNRLELLDRFARLAAHATNTTCAFLSLERGGTGTFGPIGDSKLEAWLPAVGEAAGSVSFVRDLRDSVFVSHPLVAGPPRLRFLAHRPLLSDAGRSLGVLAVADTCPRNGLVPADTAALDDVAALLVATLEQDARHARLIEVTDRAARADGILRQVAEAASCEDALTRMLSELCQHHDAAVGRIWRLAPDGLMHEVSRFTDDRAVQHPYYLVPPREPVRAGNSQTAETIRDNRPQTITYSKVPNPERFALLGIAVSAGLQSQVSFPIWLQEQRFGLALSFTTERPDLDAILADIASLANTIRPALFRKVTEERIRFMAHHDDLTQLGNRAVFNDRLAEAVRSARQGGPAAQGLALLYLDLDGFKLVNDTRGHEVGDKLLTAVAARLRASVRDGDTVARIGGDEFAIIHPSAGQPFAATQLARRLLAAVAQPFDIDGQPSVIGVSIGIALHPSDGETPDVLQRNADAALYEAKQAGRNTFRLFERALGVMQQERQLIERDLKEAIEREDFSLAYQPIVDAEGLVVRGLEALLRWTHPTRGPLSPARFVPLAEASGLILPLGRWALHAACMAAAAWERPVSLSVNFSPMQFRQEGLAKQIEDVLARTGLQANRLDLEVTEGLLLDDSGRVLQTMHELREMGVRMTLDDFGTAYASLSYLRRFPFDRIKIDKSFIKNIGDDYATMAIVQAILSLSARLRLQVVAEGVETEEELVQLRTMGCELVQGFHTGRPVAHAEAAALAGFGMGFGPARVQV